MPGGLRGAVEVVAAALEVLHADPGSVAVISAVDQAEAAVAALGQDPTCLVLGQLLEGIAQCHRAGLASSPRLQRARREAAATLQIDLRWV